MRFVFKLMAIVLLLLLVLGGVVAYYAYQEYQEIDTIKTAEPKVYALKKGTSLRQIYAEFFDKEPNSYVFRLWVRQHKDLVKVMVGTYEIPANAHFSQVLRILTSGKVRSYSISFVEGGRTRELLRLLQNDERLTHKLKKDISLEELATLLKIDKISPEGMFMPDTYIFEDGTTDLELLQRAYSASKQFLEKEYAKRAKDLPYKDAYDALIMASIVEKESAVANERPKIASVFINRLRMGMKLQTDPTVIYGVGERYKGRVLKSFLKDQNPYNTYVITGLPPTPIANPSKAAIMAALHPDTTDYLFFVAVGPDSREGHVFSKNMVEHDKAVKEYRKKVAAYKQAQLKK